MDNNINTLNRFDGFQDSNFLRAVGITEVSLHSFVESENIVNQIFGEDLEEEPIFNQSEKRDKKENDFPNEFANKFSNFKDGVVEFEKKIEKRKSDDGIQKNKKTKTIGVIEDKGEKELPLLCRQYQKIMNDFLDKGEEYSNKTSLVEKIVSQAHAINIAKSHGAIDIHISGEKKGCSSCFKVWKSLREKLIVRKKIVSLENKNNKSSLCGQYQKIMADLSLLKKKYKSGESLIEEIGDRVEGVELTNTATYGHIVHIRTRCDSCWKIWEELKEQLLMPRYNVWSEETCDIVLKTIKELLKEDIAYSSSEPLIERIAEKIPHKKKKAISNHLSKNRDCSKKCVEKFSELRDKVVTQKPEPSNGWRKEECEAVQLRIKEVGEQIFSTNKEAIEAIFSGLELNRTFSAVRAHLLNNHGRACKDQKESCQVVYANYSTQHVKKN